jgi:hypothetical protein
MKSAYATATVLLLLAATASQAADEKPNRYALLVGCTRYPNLADSYQLAGPANDVLLMRDLLLGFGFADKDIVILSEAAGDDNHPTRAHIERAFRRLAELVRAGDQVFIHLSGHGSRQPQAAPLGPERYKPDGMEEIFLPADVGRWHGSAGGVTNAIVDRDLRQWLQAIRTKGASAVVVVDACHSATIARGDDVLREVHPEALGIPKEEIEAARQQARRSNGVNRGAAADPPGLQMPRLAPELVAIYAAQQTEPTVELPMPRNTPHAKRYGLLTYTLVQIVKSAKRPLTYRELVQRIHGQYAAWGRGFPTPLVEGTDQDREFLGTREWPGRSQILLRNDDDGWQINAGAIHGLTAGSILAVYPPADQQDADRLLGYCRVSQLGALAAQVKACAFDKMPAAALPMAGRCQVAFTDFGVQRLRVALDGRANPPVSQALEALGNEPNSLIQPVGDARQAEWLVRTEGDKVFLLPATDLRGPNGWSPRFGPTPVGDGLGSWLNDHLTRIAKARNLVALAAAAGAEQVRDDAGVSCDIELLRFADSAPGTKGEVVRWQSNGLQLQAGDVIAFRVTNRSRTSVDVTLLFVDAGYGISAFFPQPNVAAANRLAPEKSLITHRAKVTSKTTGLENMIVIAVKAKGEEPPLDFTCLTQPTLKQAQDRSVGDPQRGIDSPLGQLFQHALFGEGTTRDLTPVALNDYSLRLLSWQLPAAAERPRTVPGPASVPATDPVVATPPGVAWHTYGYITAGLFAVAGLALWLRHGRRAREHAAS